MSKLVKEQESSYLQSTYQFVLDEKRMEMEEPKKENRTGNERYTLEVDFEAKFRFHLFDNLVRSL